MAELTDSKCHVMTLRTMDCLQSRTAGQLLLDPTTDEAYREDGSLLLAMMVPSSLVWLLLMLLL